MPKALLWQWQGELRTLLAVPAAVWDGRRWVDENGYPYPAAGPEQLRRCPRRVGIVSQGLITHGGPAAEFLLEPRYACVIVDEAHRARRRNLRPDGENDPADPNNLLRWLRRVARRATSLLLGTATPVQIQPIEAYDLLEALSQGNDHVLGNELSAWRRDKRYTLALAMGQEPPPAALEDLWDLLRNPLPAAEDNEQVFGTTRRHLDLPAAQAVVPGPRLHELRRADHIRLQREGAALLRQHHPFIRHIVRRTRDYLETTTDPTTGEKYLQPVAVRLFGEDEAGAILLPDYLEDAYRTAEDFCKALAHEKRSAGFLRMLLLKRMGSSIAAGRRTAQALLDSYGATPNPQPPNPLTSSSLDNDSEEDDDTLETEAEEEDATALAGAAALLTQTPGAHQLLIRLIRQLDRYRDRDPKYAKLHQLLTRDGWADRGCIIFSQYYDTAYYLSELLSQDIPAEPIGLYAGGNRSGLWRGGLYEPCGKEDLKRQVQAGQLRILFGTDAASEGLNLQRLSTLINVDLPWNPTRLEQRKGRIQRIGQVHPEIYIYNMRYRGSVEDRIHRLLSERLENLHHLFGQIPDVLEAAWIDVAEGREEDARQRINAVPQRHPFEMKYDRVTPINWESCAQVLSAADQLAALRKGW